MKKGANLGAGCRISLVEPTKWTTGVRAPMVRLQLVNIMALTTPALLAAGDLASLLSISVRTLWRLDASGKIPAAVKVGSQKRWRHDEILAWLAADCPLRAHWNWSKQFTPGANNGRAKIC